MDNEKILDLMILGRDWYYDKLIDIQKDLDTIEKLSLKEKLNFNIAGDLLVIKREYYVQKIEEATQIIEEFKKVNNLD